MKAVGVSGLNPTKREQLPSLLFAVEPF